MGLICWRAKIVDLVTRFQAFQSHLTAFFEVIFANGNSRADVQLF